MDISKIITEWLPRDTTRQVINYLDGDLTDLDNIDRSILYKGTSQGPHLHGEDHVERVTVLGTVLSAKSELSEKLFPLLLNATKYHDIGRTNDDTDDYHGLKGADKVRKLHALNPKMFVGINSHTDLDIICTSIELHSLSDKYLKQLDPTTPLHIVTSFLKDADNLDRVRCRDLDPRFLRTPHAIDTIPLAHHLYKKYNPKHNQEFLI